MKKVLLSILALFSLGAGEVSAQKTLLPFGQFSQQPWTASYYFAKNGESGPSDDWFAKDFNDSSWTSVSGPISTTEQAAPPYYNHLWESEYGMCWTRRHFTIDRLSEIRDVFFYAIHDDACVAYLNGTLIYDRSYVVEFPNYYTLNFDDKARDLLVEGDNVLAVRVHDGGGLYAYMDCGLYSYSLINGTFNNGNGWTGTFDRHGRDNNTVAYRYGRDGKCNQTIADAVPGLYKLTANACGLEYYNDFNTAWAHRNDDIPTTLYINNDEIHIPSAFSEMADQDYGWYWNIEGKYVPYYVDGTPAALSKGMYACEVWSCFEATDSAELNVGVRCNATNDISRWAVWDNMDLTYYTESEVTSMLDSLKIVFGSLNAKNQNKEVKNESLVLLSKAEEASSYIEKCRSYANLKHHELIVRRSIAAYESLLEPHQALLESINSANEFTSPATLDEAQNMNQAVQTAYDNGDYDNDEVKTAIAGMAELVKRLGYTYLDIDVAILGSLGDSILAKVENFVDVKSLKVSGNLDDTDLSTIKSRLTQLREIDMTGVNMIAFPNNFFYQHSELEIVKLPSKLQSIGEYAFYQCYAIRNIDFPSTLTSIGYSAFSECDNLQQVILPEGLVNLASYAFHSCDRNVYVKLPSTLKTIGEYAFRYNVSLKNVDFSEGLTHINRCAFMECHSLNDVVLPNSLYFIGDNAFAYNRSLSDITFNEGLYQIADNAFYDCDALTEVTLPSSLVLCNASPFDYCDNLMKVTCLSIEPPYMTDQIPYGIGMEGRELYVPALSLNVYKQTTGWDRFQTIKPIDYLPENFTVLSDLKLTLPETIPADYKPNVSVIHDQKGSSYWQYGSLTVNGQGTLSMNNFDMVWDPNYQYVYPDRTQNYTSLVNNTHLRSDNVSISMYTRNDRWSFVSFPFNVKVSDIETIADGTTNWVIRKYDGQKRASGETSETWVRLTGDDVLNAGEGYIIQGSRYVGNNWQDYSGFRMNAVNDAKKNNIFNSADATVSLNEYESEFAHNRSWNLIGNPYPCYYDTRFMDFNAPITVWNIRDNTYTAYSPSDDSYVLCPGEAFFVQRPVDNGIINFAKEGRQTNRSARAMEAPARAKASSQNTNNRVIVNVTISDGENTDRTRIVLNDNAAMDYEMDKDATKFMSSDISVPQIFTSNNGINYAINERPISDGLASLNLHIGKDGLYSISLPETVNGCIVRLEDKKEGKIVTLSADADYTFSAKSGDCTGRFLLHFSDETTGIDDINSSVEENSTFYSIQGVKVTSPSQKGVYIQNGKKVMINK